MPTVLCVCEQCNSTFYCKDELYAPLTKNIYRKPRGKKIPQNWQDWLEHISTHCEICRLQCVPTSCIRDYENQTKQL